MTENSSSDRRYIAVEGPIGAGKTSLCRKLAATFKADLLLEQPQENPFLVKFYKDVKANALATQLSFLMQRSKQMEDYFRYGGQISSTCIADYVLDKDPLFARLNLSQDELELYRLIRRRLQLDSLVPAPNLCIFLQATAPTLQKRVRKRDQAYERKLDRAYLDRICHAYTEFVHAYDKGPSLIINVEDINPIDNEEHFAALVNRINGVKYGKHFFNPLLESFVETIEENQ